MYVWMAISNAMSSSRAGSSLLFLSLSGMRMERTANLLNLAGEVMVFLGQRRQVLSTDLEYRAVGTNRYCNVRAIACQSESTYTAPPKYVEMKYHA